MTAQLAAEAATDKAIDAAIDAVPALTVYSADAEVLSAFVTDMAEEIYSRTEIRTRYGMTAQTMLDFLRRPGIIERIKARRAVFRSGESIQERNRAYYGSIALDGASKLDKIIHDKLTTATQVLDALTLASRVAGTYSPASKPEGFMAGGSPGSTFSVNINFSGGTERVVTVSTPVEAVPEAVASTHPMPGITDEDEFDGGDDA